MGLQDPSDDHVRALEVLNGNVQFDGGLECLPCSTGNTGGETGGVCEMNRFESGSLVEAKQEEAATGKIRKGAEGLGDRIGQAVPRRLNLDFWQIRPQLPHLMNCPDEIHRQKGSRKGSQGHLSPMALP
jgi:hypothetical protein